MPAKLITAQEVITLAIPNSNLRTEWIKDASIIIAQENFIRPVLGSYPDGKGLYDYLIAQSTLTGDYLTLVNDYVKPALAFFIKYQIAPDIFHQLTNTGLMSNSTENSQSISTKDKEIYRSQAKTDGDTLVSKMIAFLQLDANSKKFPEWSYGDNVKTKINYGQGGLIIRKKTRSNRNKYY